MADADQKIPKIKMELSVTPQLVYYFEQISKGEGGMQEFIGKSVPEIASAFITEEIGKMIAAGDLEKMSPERIQALEEQARRQEEEARIRRRVRRTGKEALEK